MEEATQESVCEEEREGQDIAPEEELFNDEDPTSVASPIHRSTKKPLPRKRKTDVVSKENWLLEEAAAIFRNKKETRSDGEDIFSQNVAAGLRAISDVRNRELAKLKIQEILFQAQFGMLEIPMQPAQRYSQLPSTHISSFASSSPHTSTQYYEEEDTTSPAPSFCAL